MVAGLAAGSSSTFAVLVPASRRTPTRHARHRIAFASAVAPFAGGAGPLASAGAPFATGEGPRASQTDDTEAALSRLALADAASRSAPDLQPAAPEKVWPGAGPLTGRFGERRPRHMHSGIDLDGETGDPVVAAAAGTVVVAGQAPTGYAGYGRIVLIDHPDGTETLYAHLSAVSTTVGAQVAAGEHIGAIGTSGNVTGSHLHFEVRRGGVPVDPLPWLPPR